MKYNQTKCGYIGLIGRPNVGKSTLLNRFLGQKLSITSRKPQTTRHRILGIQTLGDIQLVYVDTPGIHSHNKKAINRLMNKSADFALSDVDVVVFIVDALRWTEDDELVVEKIKQANVPVILFINKVDKLSQKEVLLPLIERLHGLHTFDTVIPGSAKKGIGIDTLQERLTALIPEGMHLFYNDQVTDRPTKFVVSEFVREKVFRLSGDELPYSITVDIEKMENTPSLVKIAALILVDKASHKRMIIGKDGAKLKEIGTAARMDLEKLLGKKVFLQLWVKVKQGWSDDERILKELGYD